VSAVTKLFQSVLACFAVLGISAAPVSWKEGKGYRYFEVAPQGNEQAGFSLMEGATTGVQFTNVLSRRMVAMNRVTENGSGVALGDVDGDGWCDIYLCGMERNNVLYRNLGGWKFEDITQAAGVACEKQLSSGAIFGDVDGDQDLDLLVNSIGGGTRLFFNDGKGQFTENNTGRLVRRFGSSSMALSDIDRDGDLDLYVANYLTIVGKDEFPRTKVEARMRNGQVVVTPPGRYKTLPAQGGNVEVFELGERDFLYVNDGKGQFAPVSWTNGNFLNELGQPLTSAPQEWSLSVMLRDINDDGLADILVCNDFFYSPDEIWLQQPGMIFKMASRDAIRKVSLASMAVDVADFNRDGHDDLFFVEMLSRDYGFRQNHRDNLMKAHFNLRMPEPLHRWEVPRNTLFLNMGDGTYAEIAELAGMDASEWSWGAVCLDVDLDGWEDVLVPTGHNHDVQNADVLRALGRSNAPDSMEERVRQLQQFPKLETPILGFRNEGNLRFTERQKEWGLNVPGVWNGFACADLDNDGDVDVVGNRLNGAASLFRNQTKRDRIAVRLAGMKGNTRGIGAKISVRSGTGAPQRQEMMAGGRYLSCDDAVRMFACEPGKPISLEVLWPAGKRTVLSDLKANAVYEVSEQGAAPYSRTNNRAPTPFFADRSEWLAHRHSDPAFDDFARQPFLAYNLRTQGPAVAWGDLDGDGLEDMIVGGARGGQMAVRRNTGKGFIALTNSLTTSRLIVDQTGILIARLSTNAAAIISANSNYEAGGKHTPAAEIRTLSSHEGVLPPETDSPGSIALGDVDSDGDLDLFVAGRVILGRYPAAASSRIYLNENGKFQADAKWSAPFERIGLTAGAQFSDLNNDHKPDLVLALEWGGIGVFTNTGAGFAAESLALAKRRGWWTSVATGDFDKDGRTDIVAGNWGRNTKYERFMREHPLRLYHGDLDANGKYDALKAVYNAELQKYVPVAGPEMVIDHLPSAAERIPSYAAYARIGMEELIRASGAAVLEIDTMESMLFLNRGGSFEPKALPVEAQFAPVFGMAVADFDNDGNEDVVLGQNLFETRWDIGRLDSGRPLWLRGDGKGGFTTISTTESGLSAGGQQRAVAIADFNSDGRMDVAMTQNNAETKLFENRKAEPGVRMRFVGKEKNPDAFGTRYQVLGTNGAPVTGVREVQAGGGWLSQNSVVQIVPRATSARLAIHWPGGAKSDFELPKGAHEILVSESGVKVVR
jgi:enediyne biosynthesis protein E4